MTDQADKALAAEILQLVKDVLTSSFEDFDPENEDKVEFDPKNPAKTFENLDCEGDFIKLFRAIVSEDARADFWKSGDRTVLRTAILVAAAWKLRKSPKLGDDIADDVKTAYQTVILQGSIDDIMELLKKYKIVDDVRNKAVRAAFRNFAPSRGKRHSTGTASPGKALKAAAGGVDVRGGDEMALEGSSGQAPGAFANDNANDNDTEDDDDGADQTVFEANAAGVMVEVDLKQRTERMLRAAELAIAATKQAQADAETAKFRAQESVANTFKAGVERRDEQLLEWAEKAAAAAVRMSALDMQVKQNEAQGAAFDAQRAIADKVTKACQSEDMGMFGTEPGQRLLGLFQGQASVQAQPAYGRQPLLPQGQQQRMLMAGAVAGAVAGAGAGAGASMKSIQPNPQVTEEWPEERIKDKIRDEKLHLRDVPKGQGSKKGWVRKAGWVNVLKVLIDMKLYDPEDEKHWKDCLARQQRLAKQAGGGARKSMATDPVFAEGIQAAQAQEMPGVSSAKTMEIVAPRMVTGEDLEALHEVQAALLREGYEQADNEIDLWELVKKVIATGFLCLTSAPYSMVGDKARLNKQTCLKVVGSNPASVEAYPSRDVEVHGKMQEEMIKLCFKSFYSKPSSWTMEDFASFVEKLNLMALGNMPMPNKACDDPTILPTVMEAAPIDQFQVPHYYVRMINTVAGMEGDSKIVQEAKALKKLLEGAPFVAATFDDGKIQYVNVGGEFCTTKAMWELVQRIYVFVARLLYTAKGKREQLVQLHDRYARASEDVIELDFEKIPRGRFKTEFMDESHAGSQFLLCNLADSQYKADDENRRRRAFGLQFTPRVGTMKCHAYEPLFQTATESAQVIFPTAFYGYVHSRLSSYLRVSTFKMVGRVCSTDQEALDKVKQGFAKTRRHGEVDAEGGAAKDVPKPPKKRSTKGKETAP